MTEPLLPVRSFLLDLLQTSTQRNGFGYHPRNPE